MTDAIEPPPPASPASEEPSVEIHKVKPIHSWRDFLKELGTIVLGIVIAIGLEHLVESWHWDQEVKTARQSLAAEISANNRNLLAFRVAIAPCVDRQIREVDALLTALEEGRSPEKIAVFRPPSSSLTRDDEWQSERASQVLTHFPRAELALLNRYYAQMNDFSNWTRQEGNAWHELSVLQTPLAGIAKSDLMRLQVNFDIAKLDQYLIVLNANRQLRVSKQLDIPDPTVDPVRVKNYCTMNTDEYRRYRSTQDLN